jgi:hypothetical protein
MSTTNADAAGTPTEVRESWLPMIAIALGQAIMSFNVASLPVALSGMVNSFNVPPTTVATGIVMYSLAVAAFVMLGAKLNQGPDALGFLGRPFLPDGVDHGLGDLASRHFCRVLDGFRDRLPVMLPSVLAVESDLNAECGVDLLQHATPVFEALSDLNDLGRMLQRDRVHQRSPFRSWR